MSTRFCRESKSSSVEGSAALSNKKLGYSSIKYTLFLFAMLSRFSVQCASLYSSVSLQNSVIDINQLIPKLIFTAKLVRSKLPTINVQKYDMLKVLKHLFFVKTT